MNQLRQESEEKGCIIEGLLSKVAIHGGETKESLEEQVTQLQREKAAMREEVAQLQREKAAMREEVSQLE